MNRLLNKIPTTIWTTIIVLIIGLLVYKSDIGNDNSDKVKIFCGLVSIIGLFFVATQMQLQKRNNIITTEFLNQPNFEFHEFSDKIEEENSIINSSPKLCTSKGEGIINYNDCTDIHWFDIKQIGKLPAKEITITLLYKSEKDNIIDLFQTRSQAVQMLYINGKHQFKLPEQAIPIEYFNTTKNGIFLILIEYLSIYSNIKYKRVYELNYFPSVSPNSKQATWVKSIKFHGLNLDGLADSMTLTIPQILKNILNKVLLKIKFKKTMSVDEWLIDM